MNCIRPSRGRDQGGWRQALLVGLTVCAASGGAGPQSWGQTPEDRTAPPRPAAGAERSAPPRAAETAPAAARGGLAVKTEPSGAVVNLGAEYYEQSPVTLRGVKAGRYALKLSLEGYEPTVRQVEIRENEINDLGVIYLVRSTGGLRLSTLPPGLEYSVASATNEVAEKKGVTPAELRALPTGEYVVRLTRPGWPTEERRVRVERNTAAQVTHEFAEGEVEVTSNPTGAEIEWNGKVLGKAPLTVKLPAAELELIARYKDWKERKRAVSLAKETKTQVRIEFPYGSVSVLSEPPGAVVRADGRPIGRTPLKLDEVPVKDVAYQLELAGYRAAVVTGRVAMKQEKEFRVQLQRGEQEPVGGRWTNSLGMVFVPVTGLQVRFCIWETRVQDYQAFATEAHPEWPKPDFEQSPLHPAVMVNWTDAKAFCVWLSQKEMQAGVLNAGQFYRLPTDLEWSKAVELPDEPGPSPQVRNQAVRGVYPWGALWPPPKGAGNYADRVFWRKYPDWAPIKGYNDGFADTSPVGSFAPNQYGIFDLAGNVSEWCEDWWNDEKKCRVLRGGSWRYSAPEYLLSSHRSLEPPGIRSPYYGFRVVLAAAP